jgi:heat shock 70kDa protein 4
MACAGVDFGSRRSVVAIARRGGVDICCNEVSNRATPSLVSFAQEQRHIGEAAANFQAQNPRNTVAAVQRLLGAAFDCPFTAAEAARLTAKVEATAAGGVAAVVEYGKPGDDGDVPTLAMPFEALAGMLFSSLLQIASGEYKAPVKDCVITVPGYYTEAQRRAVVAAACIGNVNVLRVANEHAAVALAYGIVRTAELPATDPVKVAFVDVGDAGTTVCIAAFTNTAADVKSVAFEPCLGGRDFDAAIADVFAAQFKEKHGIDVMSQARPKLRLLKEAEKVKRVLSANAQATLHIECLMDDVDVSGRMERDEFEELAKPLVARLNAVCARAIADAGLAEGEKLLSVEIVGAGTRVPAVKSAVAAAFEPLGATLMTTLNMDECVARGAALMAAMLSPAFKVRDYAINDITSFAVDAEKVYDSGAAPEALTLVERSSKFPCTKAMTFKAPGPLTINVSYRDPAELTQGAAAAQICSYKIDAPEEPDAKVRAKVKVNANGIVEVASVSMCKEVEVLEDVPAPAPATAPPVANGGAKPAEGPAAPASAEARANGDAPAPSAADSPAPTAMDTDAPAAPVGEGEEAVVDAAAAAAKPDIPAEPVVVEKRVVKKMQTTELVVTPAAAAGTSLTPAEIQQAVEIEAQMKATDRYIKERSDAMNGLEGYVYDLRARIEEGGDLKDFAPEDVRLPLKKETDEAEEWIYSEDGDKASKSAFVERRATLVKIAAPILRRKREREERPAATSALTAALEKYKRLAVPTAEEYAHIDQAEKDKALSCVEAAALWLKAETAKQDAAALHVDPILTCAAINAKRVEVDAVCGPIEKTPKPAPPPKVEVEEPKAEVKAGDDPAAAPAANGDGPAADVAGAKADAPVAAEMEVDPAVAPAATEPMETSK